jgi:hypothetical protein
MPKKRFDLPFELESGTVEWKNEPAVVTGGSAPPLHDQ